MFPLPAFYLDLKRCLFDSRHKIMLEIDKDNVGEAATISCLPVFAVDDPT